MKKTFRTLLFVIQFVVLGLALAFVVSALSPQLGERLRGSLGLATAPAASTTTATTLTASGVTNGVATLPRDPAIDTSQLEHGDSMPVSYSGAVARAAPAVVNIYANKLVSKREVRVVPMIDPILRRVTPTIASSIYQQPQQSLGSGVIVSADGYVLTNNHVIEGAEDIQAVLNDGRVAKATLVGTDPATDLAVLKLASSDLTSIAIDDQPLNVGDVVLAIGNPFGRGKTVTMGIVSAVGRQLNMSNNSDMPLIEDFVQTDAAINEGNSGGALINAHGKLVAINTAFKRDQMAEGVGFAIPVAKAKSVLDQIVLHGHVIRGWLGAVYVDTPPGLPTGSDHPTSTPGVGIVAVYPDGPAQQAGLQAGDVLLKIDDMPIASQLDLRNREASLAPGVKVHVVGLRNGTALSLDLTLQERPPLASGPG